MATRVTGWEAIMLAEKLGAKLSKRKDASGPARDDVTPDEARKIVDRDPKVIYIDFDEPEGGFRIA